MLNKNIGLLFSFQKQYHNKFKSNAQASGNLMIQWWIFYLLEIKNLNKMSLNGAQNWKNIGKIS